MTEASFLIREARRADTGAIEELLRICELGSAGVLTHGSRYWVTEEPDGSLIGVVGLEYGPRAVLLRSAGVRPDRQRRGIGTRLFAHAYAMAIADGITTVYCFSTDAGDYWTSHGFREVPVPELTTALPEAFQVHHYEELGWLPTEVAWRKDLSGGGRETPPVRSEDPAHPPAED